MSSSGHKLYGNRQCFGETEGFQFVASFNRLSTPEHIKHCAIASFSDGGQTSNYNQGMNTFVWNWLIGVCVMYVYIHVCVYVYMCIIYMCICVYEYISICIYMYLCI